MKKIKRFFISALCLAAVTAMGAVCALAEGGSITGDEARDKVWQRMWDMATVVWTPSRDVHYGHQSEQIAQKTWKMGTTYVGMPYTQSMGTLERFVSGFEDPVTDGIYETFRPWLPVIYSSLESSGVDTADIIMGNDCSGAVYWALATVADVDFSVVREMIPSNECGLVFPTVDGVAPLSCDYTYTNSSGKTVSATEKQYTAVIIAESFCDLEDAPDAANDYQNITAALAQDTVKENMFAYYSALKKGDVLAGSAPEVMNKQNPGYIYGHCMLVESVDTANQRVKVLQHGSMGTANAPTSQQAYFSGSSISSSSSSYYENNKLISLTRTKALSTECLWNFGWVSFEDLYSNYYLPLTLPEYTGGADEEGIVTVDNSEMGKLYLACGTVTSEKYRLESVTIRICKEGGVLLDEVTLNTSTYRWGLYSSSTPQRLRENSIDLASFAPYLSQLGMQAGETYRYTLSAHLSNGRDYTLKDYMFVY